MLVFIFRPTRVGKHPATVLETFGCWPRFWVYLTLFDLSDVVNITCIVHYGIEINIHTYINHLCFMEKKALSREFYMVRQKSRRCYMTHSVGLVQHVIITKIETAYDIGWKFHWTTRVWGNSVATHLSTHAWLGICICIFDNLFMMSKMAGHRMKQSEIWASGVSIQCI